MTSVDRAAVVFHWENHPALNTAHIIKKLLNRWSFTCKAFGVPNLIAITSEALALSDAEIQFRTAGSLEDALEGRADVVYVEEGGRDLVGFTHPRGATYVFGSDYGELPSGGAVSITTNNALHAEVACGVLLHHRSLQWPLR